MSVELTNIPKLLAAYSIQMYISPSRAPEGHTETLQLTYIPQLLAEYIHDKVSRKLTNGVPNAKKLITRPIMTVTSPNSPHIALTYTKLRFDHFFDHTYPPSWSKLPIYIESGVIFLSGQKINQKSHSSTAKFY